jgi:anaerobic selenocysteine-containing dehydrogenase
MKSNSIKKQSLSSKYKVVVPTGPIITNTPIVQEHPTSSRDIDHKNSLLKSTFHKLHTSKPLTSIFSTGLNSAMELLNNHRVDMSSPLIFPEVSPTQIPESYDFPFTDTNEYYIPQIKQLSSSLRVLSYNHDNKIKKMIFNKGENIIIPKKEGNELLGINNNCMLKISSGTKFVYAKAVQYDAPDTKIIIPEELQKKLDISDGDRVFISSTKLKNIKHIKVKVPIDICDPIAILEFELRNKNILTKENKIVCKIFDKTYEFVVVSISDNDGIEMESGLVYGDNTTSDINFDIISEDNI